MMREANHLEGVASTTGDLEEQFTSSGWDAINLYPDFNAESYAPSNFGPCSGMFPKSRKKKLVPEPVETILVDHKEVVPTFPTLFHFDEGTDEYSCKGGGVGQVKVAASKDQPKKCVVKQPKDDYIHMRARRGRATNSHSLAERARREKISQRMRFLQDLVPGCSKLTGKAVMLDEIINYVQSLQRQVEFLSMKLAAIEPEERFDHANKCMQDDIFASREGDSAMMPSSFYMSSLPPYQYVLGANNMPHEMMISLPNASVQVPRHWEDHESHRMMQVGFSSKIPLDNSELQEIVEARELTSAGLKHAIQ